jgi:tRNA(Ile)-lysidine synthase
MKKVKKLEDINILYKINNNIVQRNLAKPFDRILVAVSGGQDSICIIKSIYQLKKQWQWKIGMIHCDHRWNDLSQSQAKHVATLAYDMQIDYYQPVIIKSIKKENYARNWRYQMIQQVAVQYKYSIIITAHNASDRIETLFYNIIRGTGTQGMSLNWQRNLNDCFYTSSKIWGNHHQIIWKKVQYHKIDNTILSSKNGISLKVIRPFLDITRSELRDLLKLWHMPSWPDNTNHKLIIRRNRIRHRIFPYIRLYYNPSIDQALARFSEILCSENSYFNNITDIILSKVTICLNSDASRKHAFALNIELIRCFPISLQRRILKRFIYKEIKLNLTFGFIEHIRLFMIFRTEKHHIKKKHPSISLPHKRKLFLLKKILLYVS